MRPLYLICTVLIALLLLPGGVYYLKKVPPKAPVALSPSSSSEPGPIIDTLTPTLQWQASLGAGKSFDKTTDGGYVVVEGVTFMKGIDISRYTGDVDSAWCQIIKREGYEFVIVQAWGGRSTNPYAESQLRKTREAGMKTAAYCLLNFDNPDQSGEWQVNKAIEAVGTERAYLSFLAIDVELPEGWGIKVDPIQRINEAIKAVEKAGLKPIIYTSRYYWLQITGNTEKFSYLPLWDARWDGIEDINANWTPYGGWTKRTGKQYVGDTKLHDKIVDLDVFIAPVQLSKVIIEVVDENWLPISGVNVTLIFKEGSFREVTNASGLVEFEVPTTNYTVKVSKEGYIPHEEFLEISIPSTMMRAIQLYPSVRLTVEIRDEAGNPLSDVNINLTSHLGNFSKTTNSSGIAEFEIPRANYTLSISKKGYLPHQETLALSKSTIECKVTIWLTAELPWWQKYLQAIANGAQRYWYIIAIIVAICVIVPVFLKIWRKG